jgi:hypothetical protein
MDVLLLYLGIGIAASIILGFCVGRLLRAWYENKKRRV